MTRFDIFHTLVENSVISVHAVSELYSKQPEFEIQQKMPMFEQLKTQVLVKSKLFLTPH